MNFAELAAGISAASEAWKNIPNWKPVWYSQYDPEHNYKSGPDFPSKVLAYHHPDVPNLGDMMKIHKNKIFNESNEELIVGGTPCQSFSLAGLRGGLADNRGNLALQFCRILAAKKPRWFVWENVPGVLSSFSDEEDSQQAEAFEKGVKATTTKQRVGGRRFGNDPDAIVQSSDFARLLEGFSECGYSVCWRIFDSQYFGVPQRRRRLFVVGHIGADWRPPFAVLFESESLRRDFTPGKEAGKSVTDPITKRTYADRGSDNNLIQETVSTIDASYGRLQGASGQDLRHNHSTLITAYGGNNLSGEIKVATAVKGDNSHIDFESETFIAYGVDRDKNISEENSGTLQSHPTGGNDHFVIYPAAQITSKENRSNPQPGDASPGLTKTGAPHLLVGGSAKKGKNSSFDSLTDENGLHPSLKESNSQNNILHKQVVRRLTPLECERLQAFPDYHTLIPVKKTTEKAYLKAKNKSRYKVIDGQWWLMAADGPRYHAIGNSMTTYVVEWIGHRIDQVDRLLQSLKTA